MLFFYDAGQVRDIGDTFAFTEPSPETTTPDPPLLFDPFRGTESLIAPGSIRTRGRSGRRSVFKTSTASRSAS